MTRSSPSRVSAPDVDALTVVLLPWHLINSLIPCLPPTVWNGVFTWSGDSGAWRLLFQRGRRVKPSQQVAIAAEKRTCRGGSSHTLSCHGRQNWPGTNSWLPEAN